MNAHNKDVGRVEQKVEIHGSSFMDSVTTEHIARDSNKAGGDVKTTHITGDVITAKKGDVMIGNEFQSTKTYNEGEHPTEGGINVKILVKGRWKRVFLEAGKHTLKDLKKQTAADKSIDNVEKAIFQFEDDEGELCDSQPLKNEDRIHVTYDP